jgi:hypothetical protein
MFSMPCLHALLQPNRYEYLNVIIQLRYPRYYLFLDNHEHQI